MPGPDVSAILAELDRRLHDLEEELGAVGAVAPAPAAPAPVREPAATGPPAEDRADPQPPDDTLDAIRGAVDHPVEVVARADDALVLRVDLTRPAAPPRGR